ncbi:MAG: MBOAT family protein, partial [Myxococcales bacterium]|nr:MBOAT family protein [Myxococcales bacterium]
MIFTTPEFVLFLAAFLPIYAASRGRGRKWALLAASYLFYAAWDVRFLALLCGSTALDFAIARALGRVDDEATRRRLVIASALGNLGVLGLFKYHDFFAASAAAALGELGVTVHPWTLDLVLPVGVSFYTFQTLGYTIDVYRRRIAPCGSLLDFACYVAFFPQLVAGPIERASALLPQLAALGPRRRGDSSGWGLIAVGAFKKVVIADNLASIVELTYADPSSTHAAALWVGTYAFAVQIYCDFS